MSLLTYAQGNITYELNGGVTNDYSWQNKSDMFAAFMTDAGAAAGWLSLAEYQALGDPYTGTGIGSKLTNCSVLDDNAAKWGWLKTYIIAVNTAYLATSPTIVPPDLSDLTTNPLTSAGWRYAVAAFFVGGQLTAYPRTADFTIPGQPAAFMPTWQHGFAGPATYDGTTEIVLPAPYKSGETFAGWFDNAACTGSRITSIPVGASGDKVFYAKYGEYIPSCQEVWEMSAGTTTSTSGVVTYINGTTAYIQDATAGLMVEFASASSIARGDEIVVNGTTAALGAYVELTNATLVSNDAGSLPTATTVALTDLAANMFKYVSINGLKVTAYSGSNATLSDGINTVNLAAGLTSAQFSVGTIVNIKAVVTYTDAVSLVGVLSDVSLAPLAAVDPATYSPQGDNGQYTLKNRWLISNIMDNYASNRLGTADFIRGMTAQNGKLYFPDRENVQLVVVDGVTGAKLDPIKLASNVFTTDNTGGTVSVGYPCNGIMQDAAGHILVTDLVTSAQSLIQIWKIDVTTGNGTLVLNDILSNHPDFTDVTARFDFFGVYGDVDHNAIIMAANASSMEAYKWTITNGVAGDPEAIIIDNTVDGTFLKGLANPGTAPQILPVDENYFYIDGNATLPTLIDMYGNVVDGFFNVPTSVEDWAPGAVAGGSTAGPNGLTEFEVGGEYFFLMAYTNTSANPPSAFRLFKFKDANKEFKDIQSLWVFPAAGMGSASNQARELIPSVEVNEATKTATISLFAGENGYGVYEFSANGGTSINNPTVPAAVSMYADGKTVRFSEAVSAQVYNLAGQMVVKTNNVTSVEIAAPGVYVVKAQTLNGGIAVNKLIIK